MSESPHVPQFLRLVDSLVALGSAKGDFEDTLKSDGVSVVDVVEDAALVMSGSWNIPIDRARYLAHDCACRIGLVDQVPPRPRDDA